MVNQVCLESKTKHLFLGGQLLCVKHLWQMNQTLSANGML